jgi:tight adherence protein B
MNSPLALAFILFLTIILVAYIAINFFSFGKSSKLKKESIDNLSSVVKKSSSNNSAADFRVDDEVSPIDEYLHQFKFFNGLRGIILRSNVNKTLSEILVLCLLGFLLAFVFTFVFLRLPIWIALFLTVLAGFVPVMYVMYRESDRKIKFEKQLPDCLDFLSRALKAGHGVAIAIKMVADEMPDPIGVEFSTVSDELNFGIPFSQALNNMGLRVDSRDLHFFLVALNIQRETGGNLTDILTLIAKTMRDRVKLNGKVRTLSSEGRTSGMILGSMPFFMALILSVLNPGYFDPLLSGGSSLLTVAFFLLAVGGLWIAKIVRIRV